MSNFISSFEYVLENEGGFSDDPGDSGGATNFGITHDDLAKFLGHSVSTNDVRQMSLSTAQAIYEAFYWSPLHLEGVMDDGMATCIFDTGVNRGISVGAKYAQIVCNQLASQTQKGRQLSVDGKIGPLSLTEINSYTSKEFISAYYELVKAGYDAIVAAHRSQQVFYRGWMNRANRLLSLES